MEELLNHLDPRAAPLACANWTRSSESRAARVARDVLAHPVRVRCDVKRAMYFSAGLECFQLFVPGALGLRASRVIVEARECPLLM